MAQYTSYNTEDLTTYAAGGNIILPLAEANTFYLINNITQSGSITVIDDGTPVQGVLYDVYLLADITVSSGTFTFFGQVVATDLLQNGLRMCAIFDGSAYQVWVSPSFLNGAFIQGSDIAAGTIALDRLVNLTSGQVVVGSAGNVPTAVAMSGDVAIAASGATTIQANAITSGKIASDAVTTAKILDANVTLAKLDTTVQNQLNTLALQNQATVTAPVSSATTLAIGTTALDIVGAVSGSAYQAVGGIIRLTYSSIPYATSTTLYVGAAGATDFQMKCDSVLAATVSTIRQFTPLDATGATDTQIISNAALQITSGAVNPTAGNSTWTYTVFYRTYNI
jgi:hypothetical protein